MSGSDQDVVDKTFGLIHKGISNSYRFAHELKDSVINAIKQITPQEEPPVAITNERSFAFNAFAPGLVDKGRKYWIYPATFSVTSLLLCLGYQKFLRIATSLSENEKRNILVLGNRNDPIIRSQITDLYRRKYTVFVCSEHLTEEKEDEEFLYYINPRSSDDLLKFMNKVMINDKKTVNLDAILFMPNLAYHTPGPISTKELEQTLHSNIMVYKDALDKILPHLRNNKRIPLLLYNPSLPSKKNISSQPTTIFVSGCINSLYQTFSEDHLVNPYMFHLGVFKLAGQPSNYKYLQANGQNINTALLDPVYQLIVSLNGNYGQRFLVWIRTFGGLYKVFYFGSFYISKWHRPLFAYIGKITELLKEGLRVTIMFF
ncbi:Ysc83p NDAI_0G05950 [Naumovozyma dairenensis CBS 421]|uniref:DUF1776-domain-containing protein n=1 Tax=Naumovozyma dairenensis (strain ATCC 10597 / BCRC 20456 / CBS 421 / NBRC 0211 / NRRL Y-12639) TaxID=1071378 RepID=J7SB61_NAUDC|nr:hypothetical protein NDAI_0G05950 [Naumovozyma dairenensis CBS 421]CCK73578.1 hypothetical protein NDAI_0G05950 [Naumovozyma dairenensis CBS 421]